MTRCMKALLLALVLTLFPLNPTSFAAAQLAQPFTLNISWKNVRVPFDAYREEIDNYYCYMNERRFMGCMRFIESLTCALDPHSRLYVSYDGTPAQGEKKLDSWGIVMWSQTQDPGECSPDTLQGRGNFDRLISYFQSLKGANTPVTENAQKIPFETIIDSLERKLKTVPNKTEIGIAAYQQFLTWAFDPHSSLLPSKLFKFSGPSEPSPLPEKAQEKLQEKIAEIQAEKNITTLIAKTPGLTLGYMKIDTFLADGLCNVAKKHLKVLIEQKVQALVIDLRENGGGSVEEGSCIASLFLGEKPIYGVRPVYHGVVDTQKPIEYKRAENAVEVALTSMPITVLTNEGSASMSEIFAGALQDHQRAWIVGQRSFGKGSMQVVTDWQPGVVILDTQNVLYEPTGWSHQGIGVPPDFEIPKTHGGEKCLATTAGEKHLYPFSLEAPLDDAEKAVAPGFPRGWKQQRPALHAKIQACAEAKIAAVKDWSQIKDYPLSYGVAVVACDLESP